MKRFLLLLSLAVCAATSWAAGLWTPTMTSGSLDTPLYVRVYVNGTETTSGLEVAAFINGECRAKATTVSQLGTSPNYAFSLRVWGTLEEKNQTITIKAFYNKLVYVFTTTQVFDGEIDSHSVPLDLYLDEVVGFSLPDITTDVPQASLPYQKDLTSDITPVYGPNKQGKSTLETVLSYTWDPSADPSVLEMEGNTLKVKAFTTASGLNLGLTVTGEPYNLGAAGKKQFSFSTTAKVTVTETIVPVSSLTISPASIIVELNENIQTKIAELVTVTVLPNEATNKTWTATVASGSEGGFTGDIVTGTGTWTMTITSNDNPSAKADLTVNVPVPVAFKFPDIVTLSKLHTEAVAFTNFVGDNFDKSLIAITFADAPAGLPCATAAMADDTGLNWNFQGKYVGSYTYSVTYNGAPMQSASGASTGTVNIPAEVAFDNAGWSWISLYAYGAGSTNYDLKGGGADYLGWLSLDANNRIIDVRSQTGLLYNDANLGCFIGDITEFSPAGGMYKIKAKYADPNMCIINTGYDCVLVNQNTINTIQTGYTWISYPLETATTIAQTKLAATAQNGDMIIGKGVTEIYDGTQWLPGTSALEPGKGYIYYTAGGGGFSPDFSAPAGGGVKGFGGAPAEEAQETEPSPWEYDIRPFADNMPIVAALEGIETGERFSIGAFVRGECRGEGVVLKDNLFMINVAGTAGEPVTFRVYNKATKEFYDLDQTVTYSGMQGSLRAPVMLSGSGVVDGIQTLEQTKNTNDAYNLAGQKVSKNYRGIVVVNGRKVVK